MSGKMLDNLYAEVPPDVLYHYTTQAGLLAILKSASIRLTHTQYLNDRKEYRHALELVQVQLNERWGAAEKDAITRQAIDAMRAGISGTEGQCVCVFSLSEDSDSLSQWRAYGGKSGGFALGFLRETLFETCSRRTLRLAKCIYDPVIQKQLVAELVDTVLHEALALRVPGMVDWDEEVGRLAAGSMNQFCPLLKHHKFGDEKEWRLISGPIAPFSADFDFREGVSTVVPYFEVPLNPPGKETFRPAKVVVGPTPHPEEARHAVRLLLVRRNMGDFSWGEVDVSVAPYRSW
jgi:hypothetical protein